MDILFIPGAEYADDVIVFTDTATGATVQLNLADFGAGYCERENLRDLDCDFALIKPRTEFMYHLDEIAVADVASSTIIRAPVTQAHRSALARVRVPDMPVVYHVDDPRDVVAALSNATKSAYPPPQK